MKPINNTILQSIEKNQTTKNIEVAFKTNKFEEKKFWDRFADKYDSFIDKTANSAYHTIIEKLRYDLLKNSKVLDIGTGTGIIPFSVYNKVSCITAIDISPKMIDMAKQKLQLSKIDNINFLVQDSYNLEFPDNTFDIVIASNIMHLLNLPETCLKEVKRVLKNDGLFIAPTFCVGENIKTKILSVIAQSISGFKVINKWSINEFQSFLINNDFSVEKLIKIKNRIPLVYITSKIKM